jgi:hypothetical protein
MIDVIVGMMIGLGAWEIAYAWGAYYARRRKNHEEA